MIRIPYGTRHTVEFNANVWRPIVCEHCGCEFAYRIRVHESAGATDLLWLDRQGAEDSARYNVMNAVSQSIKRAQKCFPCPHCGAYQADMVRRLKSERRVRLWGLSMLIGVGLFFGLSFIATGNVFGPIEIPGQLASVVPIALSVLVAIWWLVRPRPPFDPNADAIRRKDRSFSETEYPVLRRSDVEDLISRPVYFGTPPNIMLPWPIPQKPQYPVAPVAPPASPELERVFRRWSHVPMPVGLSESLLKSAYLLAEGFAAGARTRHLLLSEGRYPIHQETRLRAGFLPAMQRCFAVGLEFAAARAQSTKQPQLSDQETALVHAACDPLMIPFIELLSGQALADNDKSLLSDMYQVALAAGYKSLFAGRDEASSPR